MVKLYSHPKDPGSYCFTPQGAREARSPDKVDEAKEIMTQISGNMWVPAGESVVRCVVQTAKLYQCVSPGLMGAL